MARMLDVLVSAQDEIDPRVRQLYELPHLRATDHNGHGAGAKVLADGF